MTRSDRAFALDVLPIVIVSVAVCGWASDPVRMTVLVVALHLGRLVGWRLLGLGPLGRELAFVAVCTLLGAANDHNTIVHHDVYAYTVPQLWPQISEIPTWMLLTWGLILRFVATLATWERLGATGVPRDDVWLGPRRWSHPALKLGLSLALVWAVRQATWAWYLDPLRSWLPYAVAGLAYVALFRPDRHERRLAALALTLGTAVEVLYIQVGGLHHYELGLVGGVPLWIVLWWPLAVLVWKDLVTQPTARYARLAGTLRMRSSSTSQPESSPP